VLIQLAPPTLPRALVMRKTLILSLLPQM